MAVLAARLREDREPADPIPHAVAVALLFALWAAASGLWTADPAATGRVARHLSAELLFLAGLALVPDRRGMVRALAIGGILGGSVLVLGFLAELPAGEPWRGRLAPFGGDPGHQARGVVLALLLALQALSEGRRRIGVTSAFAFAAGLSLSRSVAVIVAAVLGLWVFGGPRSKRLSLAGVLLLALTLGAAATTFRSDLRSPLKGLVEGDAYSLTAGRTTIWRVHAALATERLGLGWGAGASPGQFDRVHRPLQEAGTVGPSLPAQDPHNQFLRVWVELGPVGVGLLVALLGVLGWSVAARPQFWPLYLFLLLSGGTVTVLEHRYYWLALGILALASSSSTRATSGASATDGA